MRPPSGCRWCGIGERGHYQLYKPSVGWHVWAQPTDKQTKERMRARRESR